VIPLTLTTLTRHACIEGSNSTWVQPNASQRVISNACSPVTAVMSSSAPVAEFSVHGCIYEQNPTDSFHLSVPAIVEVSRRKAINISNAETSTSKSCYTFRSYQPCIMTFDLDACHSFFTRRLIAVWESCHYDQRITPTLTLDMTWHGILSVQDCDPEPNGAI
jgi:hypothetical protein